MEGGENISSNFLLYFFPGSEKDQEEERSSNNCLYHLPEGWGHQTTKRDLEGRPQTLAPGFCDALSSCHPFQDGEVTGAEWANGREQDARWHYRGQCREPYILPWPSPAADSGQLSTSPRWPGDVCGQETGSLSSGVTAGFLRCGSITSFSSIYNSCSLHGTPQISAAERPLLSAPSWSSCGNDTFTAHLAINQEWSCSISSRHHQSMVESSV